MHPIHTYTTIFCAMQNELNAFFFFAQKTKTHSRQHESTPIDYNSLELVLWFVILHIHVCSIILNDFTVILIEFSSIYNIFGIEKICVVLCVVVCVCVLAFEEWPLVYTIASQSHLLICFLLIELGVTNMCGLYLSFVHNTRLV